MNINKVSQSIASQTPDFIGSEYPLFNKFIEYYYRSQEKTGLGQNIVNNFLQYLDIDKLDIGILDGSTKVVEAISASSDNIVVESVDQFLDANGSILIGDEVIYYESTTASPNIALTPGISYEQVKLKWTTLAQIIDLFDGTTRSFPLTSQSNPIGPPSPQHLIVSVYGEVLIPGTDYTISGTNIVFTTAPRTRIASDDNSATYITHLSGFIENTIVGTDNISNSFGEGKTQFKLTRNGAKYEPIVDEYVIAVYDNKLLIPKVDYFLDGDIFIFNEAPLNGRFLSLYSIEAPIPSFGSGAIGYARINNTGELTSISINENGSNYRFQYPPKVNISAINSGTGANATALVNGIKSSTLLDGGRGYSDTNPPTVVIQNPTVAGSKIAELKATVTNGSITAVDIVSSGSGYTFTPRVTFKQPGGAVLGTPTISNGAITGTIPIVDGGQGYTTAPEIYVDEPIGTNPIRANLQAVLTNGVITSINVLNAGQGYTTTPRIAVVDPTGAQVLQTQVDGDGRVIGIELLSGGSGYEDVPSVYIVDNRTNGGTGATATASIFNGRITDINVNNFGSGYSAANPPQVVIQSPPQAEASVEIGLNEITGFSINKAGSGYTKAQFVGCARAASGITAYTESGNAIFSNNTMAMPAAIDDNVKCLDALFIKRLLDKYTEQFLPDVPELDYKKIDVRTAIKSVKDFYSAKGTSFSVAYLFKLLYGEQISISYPKDQIIKPSSATWSIDTILRATLVSGDPTNIKDGLLTQEADIADPNIRDASALVENYISIKTSEVEIFELVLSEETITGSFTVPYKTKLAEPLGTEDNVITVDSTIGWPERNGEFVISGSEVVQYKEKSLNQFIECTRSVNGVVEDWDSATPVSSNFTVFINKGTAQEVVLNVVGIVDAQQTTLTDTGSYYLAGDKLTVSKLGGTSTKPELRTWLYNVKKLIEVTDVTFGGIDNRFATITCSNPHGLLVGDQVTVYGANPIIYNGSFFVTSRDSETVFQYQLPAPATVIPQGNILVSVDLNKGKSDNAAVLNSIGPYTTNVQNSFFNDNSVYVASTGIPNYAVGPFPGSALLPGNQRKLNRFPLVPQTISTKNTIVPGPIGTWVNGVSIWSYKSSLTKTFGPVTSIDITNAGSDYDAASPPTITVSGGGGAGAAASVVVDGSITSINVDAGGSGYTSSPLVSIVGGGGSGAAATAIITKGVVSRILMNSGGTGYTSQPSITIVGGGGTGATATASVRGPIRSISVDEGGASYTSKPTISLSSGSGAVAQAIVSNGRIISIAIISAGSGYTTAPEITIQGDGFGALARATIDTDGENAGRVTSIEILNRGINYVQGTTLINLTSVGNNATFSSNVFQWTYNLEQTTTFDSAQGAVFAGFNNQYGGEYAHLSNPQRLRYILGDNLFENTNGDIREQEDQLTHSPIIGWSFDGNPIYGPYGYTDPTDQSSEITRLDTSYRLKTNIVYNADTNPYPVRTAGPLLTDEPAGKFIEDYEYVFGLGDLDQYNGRFCKTPDFPEGRYCYFVTIDTTELGNALFPYVMGPDFNSVVDSWNLNKDAVQQNIPTGVVRYRDPYENVDIDVERAPNASTNAQTTEGGDILLFDVEDENRDGIIDAAETADPDQLFEESPLQLFDYFPSVRFDSKVDIEVETITKFEDAAVTGFIVENPGKSYQVNDILTFDNTDTEGIGVSARVSRITGETITSYGFETVSDKNYGVVQTQVPHNIAAGDTVYVNYNPVMDNTNKQFVVRQLKGIEELVIEQSGSGYDEEIPPTIIIDGDGESAELKAVVTSVGSIETVNIVNSGSGYTKNPRVILSHPQVFKKADYYVSTIANQNYVKVNDIVVNDDKELFVCGKTLDANSNEVAFVSKFSALGVKEWEKTLESQTGETYTEFNNIDVSGNNIWVVGENKPNAPILAAYNPDIILAKYTQAADGLSATLNFQKGYAGISGSTRADHVTAIKRYSDTRYIIGGFTNTNSANPYDAFIASIDSTGNFAAKRKISTSSKSEKLRDLIVLDDAVYFVLETADASGNDDIRVSFGKALIGTSAITVEWIKEVNSSLYSFLDVSLVSDEFKECYVSATLRLKSDNTTKDSFWVGKFDTTGDLLWNYRYVAPSGQTVEVAKKCVIDIFGDLNVAFSRTDNTTTYKTVDTVKIGYDGKLKTHTNNEFNKNNIEGISAHALAVDNSGDVYTFGQTSWNRNEFIFAFESGETGDSCSHYTATYTGTNGAIQYLANAAYMPAYQTASPSVWENANIKIPAAQLGTKLNDDWTCEFMVYKNGSEYNTHSQTQVTLMAIGDATVSTGGLWLYYDLSSGKLELVVTNNTTALNSAGSALQSVSTTMFADNTWQFVAVQKSGNSFTGYINGIQVFTGTIASTSLGNKDLFFGNIPGRSTTLGQFRKNEQFQGYFDNIRLRNRAVTPTVPSDVSALPASGAYGLAFSWVDTAWFTTNLNRYDYIDYIGWGIKTDKNSDAARLGDKGVQTNTGIGFGRSAITPVTGSTLTVTNIGLALGDVGLQTLDFDDATITLAQDTETLTYAVDEWSSRTSTVPSPGSQKLKVTAVVRNRYYMKVTNTVKIDNVQELTINQAFNFTVGAKLRLNNAAGTFVNSGYILSVDKVNNKVLVAVNNNAWSDDLNTGNLVTEQFAEQSTYGITGPVPQDINDITDYIFEKIDNTTPGTFDIDLDKYNLDGTYNAGGGQNLDSFATFKPFNTDFYSVKIEEVSGSSSFIVGSVVNITASDISFNAAFTTAQITNLTGVLKITLVSTLSKTLQCTAVANTDEVYVITADKHYLTAGENINVDGNPSQESGGVTYDEYDGSFTVDRVVSSKEFTYKLSAAAITAPATSAGGVSIFVKSPVLKMYYGHQYLFDLSHSSMAGANLSFSKDNLFKLEYSFNSIERIGTPGLTGEGQPTPTVKLKVDRDIVTNISYYFDPSRTGSESPIAAGSYLDIVDSPYLGTFTVTDTSGGTITTGDNVFKFLLPNEPEGVATVSQSSYSTSSTKAVGPIDSIRIVNAGGFYSRLPIVTGIQSSRKIERVDINEPGTEYAPGVYNGVPIGGDGEGGLVSILVADGTDSEGVLIPGQVQEVVVTSPGKGYTTATIDIEAIDGILGAGLTGSGAELEVVIPPFGTGASIFTKGDKVGKIKKLKNNNFGYDYPHDYTLRPEITFPINAQLTSTSILDSITVTNPGSGYSQAPAVVITGGGGIGAIAEATIRNGRIDQILVKDPGSGYSSEPAVALKSSFNYVVNLDLGLLQFAFPHGIVNGSEVTLTVTDTGDGADFPLAAGALGRLNSTTTYFAITGSANSLEDDQLKLAITSANAELGDAITFANAGVGRQSLLTESFGAAATANVITSTFLEGELVYQGDTFETATATGYVSTNSGWQVGPRILKIVDYTGDFSANQRVTGVISKSSGIISDLKIAKGVLEIGSITKTTGQFIDDVGKPSEIIQKIQDSYYYQDFSYAVKSSVSIDDWKDILIKNVHPASFKVFGELNLNEYGSIPNKITDFELTKSVELARESIVPNIQNFSLVEPLYSEFNNTEVLFRQKRLTSSENILTSVVQRIDDISNLFDGERIAFPLTVSGSNVVANANQLMIVLNGVAQTPNTSFEIQGDSIVFSEPPQPPASVKYVNVTVNQISTVSFTFTNQSGIFPYTGNTLIGVSSTARLTVTKVVGDVIEGYVTEGTFIIGELCTVGATGFSANLATNTPITNIGLFAFGETVTNLQGDTAKVEQINLQRGQETPLADLRYTIGAATTTFEVVTTASGADAPVPAGTFVQGQKYQFGSEIFTVNTITDGSDSTTLGVTRGEDGTQPVAQQEDIPIYGTQISVTDDLTLSKTAGTYQSTPGLYDIELNDVIIGASSGVVAQITSTATYQDPVTQEFIGQVNISEGSSFFGLLFNRITSQTYPNIVLDDISKSTVSIVDFTDNSTAFDIRFPSNELINNFVIPYDNASGALQQDEFIRNYKLEYGTSSADFFANEPGKTRKLTFKDSVGSGFFGAGQIIRTTDTKAEVIGYNQARRTLYLGKIGRTQSTGADYHSATFTAGAGLNTYNERYGTACLALSPGVAPHTFVSGVTNAITASVGASGTFTAQAGTTYDALSGLLVLNIGTHSLTTSNKVTIADNGITFTCDQDNNTSNKTYPRATDPASGQALTITATTSTTVTVNVGAVPVDEYISYATSTEFGFGTGAFTVELWIKPLSVAAGSKTLFDFRTTATELSPYLYLDGANLKYYNNGSVTITGTTNLVAGTWYHVAISRSGSTTKMFLNGTQEGSDYSDASNYGSTKPIRIGATYNAASVFPGYVDEFRVSTNARYTGTFTAPAGIFQGDSNTKLLLHFDGTEGQTYVDDWSGSEGFTKGEEFNNDAILATSRVTGAPAGFAGKTQRYYDAANLLLANKDFIAKETVYLLTQQYPSLAIPGGNVNCEDDIVDVIEELVEDLRNGGNSHIWDTAALYVNRTTTPITINHVDGEQVETVWAFDKAKEIAQYIITNTLWTVTGSHGLTQKTDTTITDSSTSSFTQFNVTAPTTYDAASGDLVLTIGSHSLTTASRIGIATESLTFTCAQDNNDRQTAYPRAIAGDGSPDPAYNAVLPVKAVTGTTITVNIGASPVGQQYAHTFVSATANAVTVLDYTTGDCADVWSTVGNLMDIITDTLENANLSSPVDHLASVTKVEPAYEFQGGTVDAFLETDFTVSYQDTVNDLVYSNQIDGDAQYRFRDAAGLIRANRTPIVDKAAADMIARYPDLAQDMPRNQNGGSTDGTLRCKTDLGQILDAIANDIENGGNRNTITAGNFYVGANGELQHIRLQAFQSIYAHDRLGYYAKQAITGDLDETNTDAIIVGDWGITQDGGNCANVQSAIDTLITTINDIIAPTDEDFEIAADRIYFNRNYIAEEITGLTTQEFTYDLNGVNYSALTYPGSNGAATCQRDLKLILLSIISDLQTGGTNSTIQAIELYLNANLTINHIENELLATIYSIELLKTFAERAVQNLLYDQFAAVTGDQYAAQFTSQTAYRDVLTPTAINNVIYRIRDLVDTSVAILAPGKDEARSAAKNLLYNKNYYKEEISTQAIAQFGVGAWTYDTFVEGLVDDIVHDLITTDVDVSVSAYTITLSASTGAFVVGETVTSSGGGTATVLDWDAEDEILYVGAFTGTAWAAADTLSAPSSATGTIATSGVSSAYDWYTSPANVKILAKARTITSNIAGQISGINLFTNPEAFAANWQVNDLGGVDSLLITNNSIAAPDATVTAEKFFAANSNGGVHDTFRDYSLTAFETFDSGTVKFDTSNETFDTGSAGIDATQTFTYSVFFKTAGSQSVRFQLTLDPGAASEQNIFFDLNLNAGTTGSLFIPQGGITGDAFGAVPYGDGWYRAYITTTFGFGFSTLRSSVIVNSATGANNWTGDGSVGAYLWGAKLNKGALDPYTAVSGEIFYADTEYNIKNYAINLLEGFMGQALDGTLTSPSTSAGFYSYYDATKAGDYTKATIQRSIRYGLNIIREQLTTDSYYTTLIQVNGISLVAKTYGVRDIPVGIAGGLQGSDYIYGLNSDSYAELEGITVNEAKVVQVYKRFRIDGTITDGPFIMGEVVTKQGAPSVTGVVYGFHEDANYKYLDVRVTAGPWAVTDTLVGATNSTTAQISAEEDRLHVIDLKGDFANDIPFKGYTSGNSATPTGFLKTQAAVTSNAGGTLTVDTPSLLGSFEKTSVVYPESSREYLDVSKYAGLDVQVGQRIASEGYIRLGVAIVSGLNVFTVGNRIYKVVNGNQDTSNYGIITEVDLGNNYIYITEVVGSFSNGDLIGDYGVGNSFPVGYASISTKVTTAGAAAALVQDIRPVGLNRRIYLSDIRGTFDVKDSIKGLDGYRAAVLSKVELKARTKRAFKGFDGTQTNFKLTTDNGTQYLPDPAGHLLIFINGVLQPPGATNAFTAFSDEIQFTEAPDPGASFTGFYVGKLRQLDDISFEFDSLRQSFNLKRNDVFYSLTLTDGVQSSVIRPENNIIVSINGVLQEPGVGFEIVGSRIIFSEIPRVGSTFVAFSYVGSEADVEAATVVPPIESGDFIEIQGETSPREVALIESSNSLITFDYLGSVFGQDGQASANLTSGFIDRVQVTAGGSNYTSRPTVRLDSISGFDGQVRALVGVAGVEMSNAGSGYQNPEVIVETSVPDDWTAPDLSLYGEEVIDPEIL